MDTTAYWYEVKAAWITTKYCKEGNRVESSIQLQADCALTAVKKAAEWREWPASDCWVEMSIRRLEG